MHLRFDFWTVWVAALGLGAAVWVLRRPGRSRWRRAAAWGILLFLALEPVYETRPGSGPRPVLAVLVDVSQSMGIRDPEERLKSAQSLLQKSLPELKDKFELEFFAFSQTSAKITESEFSRMKPQGTGTDLLNALRQVQREKGPALSGILVFSDGRQTAASAEEASAPSFSELSGVPVFTVGLGNESGLKDVRILEVRGADFAFKNRPLDLEVRLQSWGLENRSLPVQIKEVGTGKPDILTTQVIALDRKSAEQSVSFRIFPQAPGTRLYRAEIPPQPGETALENNRMDFSVTVGREKVRVLYLCGQPSPEYAFLRQVLKTDPGIELVSFVILRNPENIVPVPEDQLSLIPFPANDIFVTALPEFDLLIFENFSYSRLGILASHLDNIRNFVEEKGGGFLMMGGENSFGRGGYPGTGLEPILPVRMSPSDEAIEPGPWNLKVLEPQNPIFDLGNSLQETQAVWQRMPPLWGYHRLSGVKKDALLLATCRETGAPIAVGWQRKKGRVLALATLSTWQWALGLSERGFLQSNYTQFWRETIRWLTNGGDQKPVRLVLGSSHPTPGQKLLVRALVSADHLRSSDRIDLDIQVQPRGAAVLSLPWVRQGKTEFRAEWIPDSEGETRIRAELREGLRRYEDEKTVEVRAVNPEQENPYPDFEFLKKVAESTGGSYFEPAGFSPDRIVQGARSAPAEQKQSRPVALGFHPAVLFLALALLFYDWGKRRWEGGF